MQIHGDKQGKQHGQTLRQQQANFNAIGDPRIVIPNENLGGNRNDLQLQPIVQHYPKLLDSLNSSEIHRALQACQQTIRNAATKTISVPRFSNSPISPMLLQEG